MVYWFTTLTLADRIPLPVFESFLKKHFDVYLYVHEMGRSKNNPHWHLLVQTDAFKRSDKLTEFIKNELYVPLEIPTNKRTVVTRCDPVTDLDSFIP